MGRLVSTHRSSGSWTSFLSVEGGHRQGGPSRGAVKEAMRAWLPNREMCTAEPGRAQIQERLHMHTAPGGVDFSASTWGIDACTCFAIKLGSSHRRTRCAQRTRQLCAREAAPLPQLIL